ncbi:MAG: hypothetical protein RMJ19_08165, partial [Gemmatales bacterium]|nr:hypothetical protein [Gemmatales bacterium]MDW8175632.1 hypothetical protein [Gemmatales bacterium]
MRGTALLSILAIWWLVPTAESHELVKPPKALRVLIITGDHGHAWRETTPFLKDLLTKAGH